MAGLSIFALVKDHDRPSAEYSQLVSVAEFKAGLAGVHSRQCEEGLAGVSKKELKAAMNISDSDLEGLESTCRFLLQ